MDWFVSGRVGLGGTHCKFFQLFSLILWPQKPKKAHKYALIIERVVTIVIIPLYLRKKKNWNTS